MAEHHLVLSERYGEHNAKLLLDALEDIEIASLRCEDFQSPVDPTFHDTLSRFLNGRNVDSVTLQGGNLFLRDIGTTQRLILRQVQELGPGWARTLMSFQNLKSLSLISMSLSSPLVTVLAEMRLESLDLNDSRFVGEAAEALSEGLRNNTLLQTLGLSECNLMDEQVEQLVESLWDHPSLRELDISFNKCRANGMSALAGLLESTSTLTKLGMSFLAFGEAKQIPIAGFCSALTSNETLKELELGANSLRDGDLLHLVEALCSCRLQSLDLSQNRFSTLAPLAARLGDIRYLRQLTAEDNRLGIDTLDAMVDAFSLDNCNVVLEDVEMDILTTERRDKQQWQNLHYQLDLNWGGRRLLSQDCDNIPLSLWPLVLERANNQKKESENRLNRDPVSADIIFFFLRGVPVLTSTRPASQCYDQCEPTHGQ